MQRGMVMRMGSKGLMIKQYFKVACSAGLNYTDEFLVKQVKAIEMLNNQTSIFFCFVRTIFEIQNHSYYVYYVLRWGGTPCCSCAQTLLGCSPTTPVRSPSGRWTLSSSPYHYHYHYQYRYHHHYRYHYDYHYHCTYHLLPQWGRWGTGEHREHHFHLDLDNNSNDCLTQLKVWNLDKLSSYLYFCESLSLSEISDIQPNLLFLINHTIKPNNFGHYASKMAPLTLWDPLNAILN